MNVEPCFGNNTLLFSHGLACSFSLQASASSSPNLVMLFHNILELSFMLNPIFLEINSSCIVGFFKIQGLVPKNLWPNYQLVPEDALSLHSWKSCNVVQPPIILILSDVQADFTLIL